MSKELDSIMRPKSIAVIGASAREGTVGNEIVQKLKEYGYEGTLYPVNPKADEICGFKAYKSLSDIPENVDLAVIVVAKNLVLSIIDQCNEKGIKGIVTISAGFKETGSEGAKLEQELLDKIRQYGMRMVGPNCLGVINTEQGIKMNATFAEAHPLEGKTAFTSQSGALGAAILNISKDIDLGISQFVSIGNAADITGETLLEYWKDDENIEQILLYMESIAEPQLFSKLAKQVTRKKPVIAIKAGRSAAGASAASSHTGSLAGADLAADALLKQSGVIRINSLLEMFEVAEAFANCPVPKGNRVAIMTNAGGPGIMATDAVCEHGLEMAQLKEETKKYMRSYLPEAASVKNPVDMIASAPLEHYQNTLKALIKDENVDAIMVIYLPLMNLDPMDVSKTIMEMKEQHPEKPIVAVIMAKNGFFGKINKVAKNLPFYQYPEPCANALSRLYEQRVWMERPEGNEPSFEVDKKRTSEIIAKVLQEGRNQLTTLESIDVLDAYGIRTCKYAYASNIDEAAAEANKIGYPVVMKITSTKISHKTEIGGVIVDIKNEEHLREEYNALLNRLKEKNLEEGFEGVIIQEMVKGNREMVCGVATDPQYGHLMMFGLGGIYIETIKDVAFRVNPVTDIDVKEMVQSVKAYKIIQGTRGEKPGNIEQIEETMLRLSQLIRDFSFIKELDINPLKISDKTGEGVAVDGRIEVNFEEAKKAINESGMTTSSSR